MNTPFCNDAAEADLIGRWTCTTGKESCAYSFEPGNHFTCVVTRAGEPPFKVHGYWDVLENHLRIGTSPTDAEKARLTLHDAQTFSTALPNGGVVDYHRISEPGTSPC